MLQWQDFKIQLSMGLKKTDSKGQKARKGAKSMLTIKNLGGGVP